jgi:alkylated DNA repair dioxygenase AlkB
MEAIDFKKLLREEKKKRQRHQPKQDVVVVADHKKSPNNLTEWHHREGFLSLENVSLNLICDDPKSIFYSRTCLTNHHDGEHNDETQIPATTEVALEKWLQSLPSGDSGLGEWKTMNYGKRQVCMFGEDSPTLPPPLDEIARELVKRKIFPESAPPNHVLLNAYQAGQGILPHTDGGLYFSRTATISLSSSVVIEFTKRLSPEEIGNTDHIEHTPQNPIQILLEPGSLLVFQDDAYLNYCHGIPMNTLHDETTMKCLNAPPKKTISRGLRYSLTFRHKNNNMNK